MRARSTSTFHAGLALVVGLGVSLAAPSAARSDEVDTSSYVESPAEPPRAPPAKEAAAAAVAAPSAASSAHVEIAALAGYVTPPIRGGTNPFGGGLGGRFGLVLSNVYLGGKVTGYLGGSELGMSDRSILYGVELGYGFRTPTFWGTRLVIRPSVGAGGATIFHTDPTTSTTTTTGGGGTRTRAVDVISSASVSSGSGGSGSSVSDTTKVSNVYVEPGLSVLWTSGTTFVGAVGTVLVVPGIAYSSAETSTWVSYGLSGQLGLNF